MPDRRELVDPIPADLDIILDQVMCVGNEAELSECARDEFGNARNCLQVEAAACLCIDGTTVPYTCVDKQRRGVLWCLLKYNILARFYPFKPQTHTMSGKLDNNKTFCAHKFDITVSLAKLNY